MFDEKRNNDREPLGSLTAAVEEFRSSEIKSDVLFRAENSILNRMPVHRKVPQKAMFWLAGAAVVASAVFITLAPGKSFAAEVRQIALNGDSSVRHIRTYEVQPDGSLKLGFEEYSDGMQSRFIDIYGNQFTSVNGRVTSLHPDGSATVETQGIGRRRPTTASQMVSLFVSSERISGVSTSVKRGISWHGLTVDKYVAEGTFRDGQEISRHSRMTLIADPRGERPIELDGENSGLPAAVSKWDYPVPDAKLFKLPIDEKTRMYDLDAEHASILDALSKGGRKVTVGKKTVELIQLWVDEGGQACAIAQADYAYPENYGIHVDDLTVATEPEEDPFSGRYAIDEPTEYNRQPVQLFFTPRAPNAGPIPYKDKVTVQIPVFENKTLIGYAKFEDVPVHRAWNLTFLLKPMNIPFWVKDPPVQHATATADQGKR